MGVPVLPDSKQLLLPRGDPAVPPGQAGRWQMLPDSSWLVEGMQPVPRALPSTPRGLASFPGEAGNQTEGSIT